MENFASVTDADTPKDAAALPPLTVDAQNAFRSIADWCEEQRGEAAKTAKPGKVATSFPASAEVKVNCDPASCMPSPESPQKRTTIARRPSTGLAVPRVS